MRCKVAGIVCICTYVCSSRNYSRQHVAHEQCQNSMLNHDSNLQKNNIICKASLSTKTTKNTKNLTWECKNIDLFLFIISSPLTFSVYIPNYNHFWKFVYKWKFWNIFSKETSCNVSIGTSQKIDPLNILICYSLVNQSW